jgi:hypothetical protein
MKLKKIFSSETTEPISINEKNWFAESMFFVGVHWMEFVSHVKFRQLQAQH